MSEPGAINVSSRRRRLPPYLLGQFNRAMNKGIQAASAGDKGRGRRARD